MNFEKELEKGVFTIPQCEKCSKTVWPPTDYCDRCFGKVNVRKGIFECEIIEYSKSDNEIFGIIEIEKSIRIMAKILGDARVGRSVKIKECGISNGNYFFSVE